MAISAAIPSTSMETALCRLHNNGAGAFAETIIVDGMAADIAIQPTPTPSEGPVFQYPSPGVQLEVEVGCELPE